jgi:hypothetical protein
MLGAGYMPMLYLVVRREVAWKRKRKKAAPKLEKERRRPNRLPDEELKVDITANGAKAVSVRVTHIPTRLSATESGANRQLAERKAQDKLAAIVAEALRRKKE